ncbi:MAG TPA: hypothetical protein VE907_04085 [Gammaproteobacteria bacterium]|nr:hypothetical protein [Gammaproteobacteria bacterium]
MSYEYGSQQVDIPNPFRFEGIAYAVRAAALLSFGVYALLGVRPLVAGGQRTLAAIVMAGGVALLGFGVFAAYRGLYKVFRFYVGRGQPADLASVSTSQQSVMPGAKTGGTTGFRGKYGAQELADMLVGRKNPTFREPEGWLPRMLHSLLPNLIFLPYAFRNDAGSRFAAFAHSVVLLMLLGLAWFSGATGLVPMAGTQVMPWIVAIVTGLLFVIWGAEALRSLSRSRAVLKFTPRALVLWIAVAALAPLGLVALNGTRPLPAPPISPMLWFMLVLLTGGASVAYSLFLAVRRAPRTPPPTRVSEYRKHWQESVHPSDIFRAIEITLAKHRFQEIPNRIYENDVPELNAEGSQNKGEFKGRTVQEIQPRPTADRRADFVLKIGIAAGQALLLVAAAVLLYVLLSLSYTGVGEVVAALLGALLLWIGGRLVALTSNLYVSEIEFESDLISFAVTGTFSESRFATGMGINDSTRSENVLVRSSLTPWLVVSRIQSSTLAISGSDNLEQQRLILGMEEDDALSAELVADALAFLHDRQIIATVGSQADLQAAANIYQMNERTRAQTAPAGQPLVSQEMRNDKFLQAPADPGASR